MTGPEQERQQAWCPRCGIVRRVVLPAWCRHYALDRPAARMIPLPTYHPCHELVAHDRLDRDDSE